MSELATQLRAEHIARLGRFGVSAIPKAPVVLKPAPLATDRLDEKPKTAPQPRLVIVPVLDFGRQTPITSKTEAREIVRMTADQFGLLLDEMYSKRRNQTAVFARHVAIHRLRKRFPHWSYPQIGAAIGREHTSVMYALGLLQRKPSILDAVREAV